MKPETRIALLKELEKMKSNRSKNSYAGACFGLFVSMIWLAQILITAMSKPEGSNLVINFLVFIGALILLLQSFYGIIQHITNKKLVLLFEAILESKDTLSEKL